MCRDRVRVARCWRDRHRDRRVHIHRRVHRGGPDDRLPDRHHKLCGPLDGLRSWLEKENAVMMAVLLLVIGTSMIGKGIGSFRPNPARPRSQEQRPESPARHRPATSHGRPAPSSQFRSRSVRQLCEARPVVGGCRRQGKRKTGKTFRILTFFSLSSDQVARDCSIHLLRRRIVTRGPSSTVLQVRPALTHVAVYRRQRPRHGTSDHVTVVPRAPLMGEPQLLRIQRGGWRQPVLISDQPDLSASSASATESSVMTQLTRPERRAARMASTLRSPLPTAMT